MALGESSAALAPASVRELFPVNVGRPTTHTPACAASESLLAESQTIANPRSQVEVRPGASAAAARTESTVSLPTFHNATSL
ncbi:hypothetical protein PsYK624_131360 [Phanerochaete sordida]|uniref:Uncharacterized protein n=1 Tax=Phanerochaete sordida TaxID=48140 RepID=A0A9P3LJ57_9APHY|nr:hypothetical protein PsYK624_131360 [Phanerochaete sordida]